MRGLWQLAVLRDWAHRTAARGSAPSECLCPLLGQLLGPELLGLVQADGDLLVAEQRAWEVARGSAQSGLSGQRTSEQAAPCMAIIAR